MLRGWILVASLDCFPLGEFQASYPNTPVKDSGKAGNNMLKYYLEEKELMRL